MNHLERFTIGLIAIVLLLSVCASAAAPKLISYQGIATDAAGTPVSDGAHPAIFQIYDRLNNLFWTETAAVSTKSGLFSHTLGSVTPLNPTLFNWRDSLFLQVTFEGQVQLPRTIFTATPYAYAVNSIDGSLGGIILGSISVHSDPADDEVAGIALDGSGNPNLWMKDLDGINQIKLDAATRTLAFTDAAVTSTPARITSQDSTLVLGNGLMRLNRSAVRIGDSGAVPTAALELLERKHSTSVGQTGIQMSIENSLAGGLTGISCKVGDSTSADGSGARTAVDARAFSGYYPGANSYGVKARAQSHTHNAYGVYAEGWAEFGGGSQYGVYATVTGTGNGTAGYFDGGSYGSAGYFVGRVQITGTLTKGGGAFRIDHPLDPENKYLQHSFVESPDMKNIYDGIVTLDARGSATITLPDWFSALNRDFRYQLTCIGGYAPVYVGEKMQNNRFTIAGGQPGLEISWQVTGIRKDKWAESNRIEVEVDKPANERGTYLHPREFGQPIEKSVDWEQREQSRENRPEVDSERE